VSDGVTVDLHRTLSGIGPRAKDPFELLATETEPFLLVREQVDALVPSARAFHVAIHAAHHGAPGQRFLDDLERALRRATPEEWRLAADLAERLDAIPAFAAGLRLLEPGRGLAERLGLPDEATPEVVLRAGGLAPAMGGLIRLGRTPGLRAKVQLVAREAFPRPAYMRTESALARSGPPGLAAAYALRLGRLAWHVPGAWLAVHRARRTAPH
jgi:hypothetical protein